MKPRQNRMRKKSDWDMKVRAPIVEGPSEEFGLIPMEEEGSDYPRLQTMFESDPVDRLRVIDYDGNLYDILDMGPRGIGVEPLELAIRYLGVTPCLTWEEAEGVLPKKYEEFNRIRSRKASPSKLLEGAIRWLIF